MPRLEANKFPLKGSMWIIFSLSLLFFSACTSKVRDTEVDKLNHLSYTFHYKDLDSTDYYAARAISIAKAYPTGRAAALNNLAFSQIARMNYSNAKNLLDSIYSLTDNQIELLVADVQNMRLCQRMAKNKEFYDYMQSASSRIKRIEEETFSLSQRGDDRFIYAKTEFSIVSSTYYYYVGLEDLASKALQEINPFGEIQKDSAQYMNYLYQIGSGGIIINKPLKETVLEEFDHLLRCYIMAQQTASTYWQANAIQAISELLLNEDQRNWIAQENPLGLAFVNEDDMQDELLRGYLAKKSLDLFTSYGDVYQIAGAYRTLAYCYWEIGDYPSSLICLDSALSSPKIKQAPNLVASIRENLSLVYSAMGNKPESDLNRNIYLDMQEKTRQDRQLEARAEQLEKTSTQLNVMIVFIILLIVLVVSLFLSSRYRRQKTLKGKTIDFLLQPLHQWEVSNNEYINKLQDQLEELKESLETKKLHLEEGKQTFVDSKAKISLAVGVLPYIDRIILETEKLEKLQETDKVKLERFTYIKELINEINTRNDVLTNWIKLQQGQLNLKIESFSLSELFSIIAKSSMSFSLKGITLNVIPTNAWVKADKILTLFMLNTLSDNARKFTQSGGTVTLSAKEEEDTVEIAVEDTGSGMTKEELSKIFERKVYDGHGFGLMNCRGIMDKYKKVSQIFSSSGLFAQSQKGKGSKFFFRLPKGVARSIVLFIFSLGFFGAIQARENSNNDDILSQFLETAGCYADSAYYSNVEGEYLKTIVYADSAINYLNKHYRSIYPTSNTLMLLMDDEGSRPAEILWFEKKIPIDYDIILDVRNEVAVAALALNDWDIYKYNNRAYTRLFKDKSSDESLDAYCQTMQHSSMNKSVAIVLLVLLLIIILVLYYFLYYRNVLQFRFCVENIGKINEALLSKISDEEKLEAISKVDINKYPDNLKTIVKSIQDTLSRSLEVNKTWQEDIESTQDEFSRLSYEDEKFYVCNNVIDNLLSTLKHETMYYPSRIRQIIESQTKNIKVMKEVASFYKELYTILSEHLERQAEAIGFEHKKILLKDDFGATYSIKADKELFDYLVKILKKDYSMDLKNAKITLKDEKYIVFDLTSKKEKISLEEVDKIFFPSSKNIPLLISSQIVREIASLSNLYGCGITASSSNEGFLKLQIVLPSC